jgi:Tfp pilus assembly protein PilF
MKSSSKKIKRKDFQPVSDNKGKYHYLIVFLLPLILLSFSLHNGFVYFDDDILILDNQAKISDLSNIGKAFRSDAFLNNSSPYYRPLLNISLMLDAQVAKADPGFYHFMNLVYHCLCCISLLWFFRLLGIKREIALAGAIVFSVHPLMASAVFWIPARNDLLVTLFGLLFLSLSITFFHNRKPLILLLAIVSFAAAIFSKESAVLLPFILALYLLSTRQYAFDRRKIFLTLGLILVTAVWFILRMSSIRMVGAWQLGLWAVVANFSFPLEIIAKFILPFDLAVTPVYSSIYTGLGMLFFIVILFSFFIRKEKVVWLFIFGITWYIAFSLPNMFVRLDTSPSSYDYLVHRAYFPLVGLLVSILSLIPGHWVRFNYRPFIVWFSILIVILGGNSVYLGTKYRNAASFWNSAIAYHPDRAWFHHFLGRYYFKQHDYILFEQQLRKAISLNKHPHFLYNLGMLYFVEKKSYDSAFLLFNEARATGFTDPEANTNYVKLCLESARAYFEQGQYKKAVDRCQLAVDLEPENSVAAYNLGLYLIYSGEKKRAATSWRRSISLDPELKEAYRNLYYYYRNNTTFKDSVEYFAREYRKRGGSI